MLESWNHFIRQMQALIDQFELFEMVSVNSMTASGKSAEVNARIMESFHKPNADANINLHAREIIFIHPVSKEKQRITASLPENEFWEQFLTLDRVKIKDKDIGRIV